MASAIGGDEDRSTDSLRLCLVVVILQGCTYNLRNTTTPADGGSSSEEAEAPFVPYTPVPPVPAPPPWPMWYDDGSATFLELPTSVAVISPDGRHAAGMNLGNAGFLWSDTSHGPSLTTIGTLEPVRAGGWVTSMNADGTTVVGTVGASGGPPNCLPGGVIMGNPEAFLWTAARGIRGLGFLPGYHRSCALAVSLDGTVVVGTSTRAVAFSPNLGLAQAFIWTEASGMRALPALPGDTDSWATAATPDAAVVVGISSGSEAQLVTWSAGNAPVALAGTQVKGFILPPVFVSSDASVVVAAVWDDGNTGSVPIGSEPIRWKVGEGTTRLGFPIGATDGIVTGLSADGKKVVGLGDTSSGGSNTFMWTEAGGMQSLFTLPIGWSSVVSPDAPSVLANGPGPLPLAWNSVRGLHPLFDVVPKTFSARCHVATVTAMSADGKLVGGDCTGNPAGAYGWIARLP